MMKNNKGITMISLIIIVVMMILLASVTAYEANGLIKSARAQSIKTDLLLIQAKIRIINEQVIFEGDEEKQQELLKGTQLSSNSNILNSMKNKKIINENDDIEKYYVLSQQNLDDMGLDTLNATDGYVVNYEEEEVIYVKGVKNSEGKYLYKVTEMGL